MSEPKDGGPAFPHVGEQFNHDIGEREVVTTAGGMTLRDYFAAKAMAEMISHPRKDGALCGKGSPPKIAAFAYEYADAMLKARQA